MKKARSPIIGRWRIIEADLWDRDDLDLCGPATMVVGADGRGEIAYGALQAGLDIAYGADDIDFTCCGFDEMDEVQGAGSAELQDNGSISIEIAYHFGDEASSQLHGSLLQQPARRGSDPRTDGWKAPAPAPALAQSLQRPPA